MISNTTFLNTKQVAGIIGYSSSWVRMLALSGELKYYRPKGRRFMKFKARDVAAYMGCKVEEL